jgi:hypothetical protein
MLKLPEHYEPACRVILNFKHRKLEWERIVL